MAKTYGFFPDPQSATQFMARVNKLWEWFRVLRNDAVLMVPETEEITFYNDSGETIPPHGIMQVTNGDYSIAVVSKPADRYGRVGPYLVNGNAAVPADKYGVASRNATALVNVPTGSSVAFNKRLSPEAGQWYAIENPCGPFVRIGPAEPLSYAGDFVLAQWVGFPPVVEFVAPLGGIAAATGTTTRTFGSAACDIWADTGTAGQSADASFSETIYNAFDSDVPGSARGYAALSGKGIWRALEIPIVDLRLSGFDYQYLRGGTWYTWVTGSDCPEP